MVPIQKQRDILKLYAGMTDGKTAYFVTGIELQDQVHYATPVKNGLYDMMELASQVQNASKSYKNARRLNNGKEKLMGRTTYAERDVW